MPQDTYLPLALAMASSRSCSERTFQKEREAENCGRSLARVLTRMIDRGFAGNSTFRAGREEIRHPCPTQLIDRGRGREEGQISIR